MLNELDFEDIYFIELLKEFKHKFKKPKVALVVPMSSCRNTLKKVFSNIKGLTNKMVIGPAEVANSNFDILIVDESHRLRRRVNLGAYFGSFDIAAQKMGFEKGESNELDWIIKQSNFQILFYDYGQSIKPSDIEKSKFDDKELWKIISDKLMTWGNQRASRVDYIELAENADDLSKKQIEAIEKGTVIDWVNEVHKITNDVYGSVNPGDKLSYRYSYLYLETVRTQLQKGGIRLAKVLNDIFD